MIDTRLSRQRSFHHMTSFMSHRPRHPRPGPVGRPEHEAGACITAGLGKRATRHSVNTMRGPFTRKASCLRAVSLLRRARAG
jgi:hypothetical protein